MYFLFILAFAGSFYIMLSGNVSLYLILLPLLGFIYLVFRVIFPAIQNRLYM